MILDDSKSSRWAVAGYAREEKRLPSGGMNFTHQTIAFMVEASSKYEARGKGMVVLMKLFPVTGFVGHSVQVCSSDNVLDPEKEVSLVHN